METIKILSDKRVVVFLEDEPYELTMLYEDEYYIIMHELQAGTYDRQLPNLPLFSHRPELWNIPEFVLMNQNVPSGEAIITRTWPIDKHEDTVQQKFSKMTDNQSYNWRPVLIPLDRNYQYAASIVGNAKAGTIVKVGQFGVEHDTGVTHIQTFDPYLTASRLVISDTGNDVPWLWWNGMLVCLSNQIITTRAALKMFGHNAKRSFSSFI